MRRPGPSAVRSAFLAEGGLCEGRRGDRRAEFASEPGQRREKPGSDSNGILGMLIGLPSTVLRKEKAMASTGLSHVELTVRDLERSLHFYCDLLGLRVVQEGTEQDLPDSQSYEGIFERPSRKFRFVVLHYSAEPAGPYGMGTGAPIIVLLEPQDPSPTGTSIKADQVGITHI